MTTIRNNQYINMKHEYFSPALKKKLKLFRQSPPPPTPTPTHTHTHTHTHREPVKRYKCHLLMKGRVYWRASGGKRSKTRRSTHHKAARVSQTCNTPLPSEGGVTLCHVTNHRRVGDIVHLTRQAPPPPPISPHPTNPGNTTPTSPSLQHPVSRRANVTYPNSG